MLNTSGNPIRGLYASGDIVSLFFHNYPSCTGQTRNVVFSHAGRTARCGAGAIIFSGGRLGLFFAFLMALMGSCSWAAAQRSKPFYEGKTIQFLVSSGPGATTDISAARSSYLGKHIPGNPGIIVQNMPGEAASSEANYLYNVAKPDGLTILAVSRANYLDQMVGRPEVEADFRKFSWIGSFNKAPMMAACRTDTPYKSIAAIRAANAAAVRSIRHREHQLRVRQFDRKNPRSQVEECHRIQIRS